MNRILVVAAHPDDEILGVGGTIKRLTGEGKVVNAVILAEGMTSREVRREYADETELIQLHNDAKESAGIIGYHSIEFCNFPDNQMDTVPLLEIIKKVSAFIEKYEPDTIFTHHHGDLNVDHRRTCEAVLTACRPMEDCRVKRIYAFETPSSTEWNYTYTEPFLPNVFFDVANSFDSKVKAMACYRTESRVYPHPRSPEALKALAEYRGSNVGLRMAEGFVLLREIY